MLALFCLRLAWGLLAALLLLSPAQVNPRFYRVHFLTALGLTAAATAVLWETAGPWLGVVLTGALVLGFVGSVVWSLEGAPAGRAVIVASVLGLTVALGIAGELGLPEGAPGWLLVSDLTSAAVLGTATTAMLMGHSYLIAPAMSLTPLLRLLGALFAVTLVRMVVAAGGLWFWTAEHALDNLNDVTVLWLPVRWGLGFVSPLILGWMAWEAAKLRSTQSATGILYVVVICCFLGELTGQLLLASTRLPL